MQGNLLIMELTTAGGIGDGEERIQALGIEGISMLKAIIEDALRGGFNVHAIIMEGIPNENLLEHERLEWHVVGCSEDVFGLMQDLLNRMDFAFLIAPEFGNFLYSVTRLVEDSMAILLTHGSKCIKNASNKKNSLKVLFNYGISVPKTWFLNQPPRNIPLPCVIKPNHGAGCVGVFKIGSLKELKDAEKELINEGFPVHDIIIQEFIPGKPLSASAIGFREKCHFLGINHQEVYIKGFGEGVSKYSGGMVGPVDPNLHEECSNIAQLISQKFNMEGYFGYDFILTPDRKVFVVEINPRLTTPFTGYNRLMSNSMLEVIARNKLDRENIYPLMENNIFKIYRMVKIPSNVLKDGEIEKIQKKYDLDQVSKLDLGGQMIDVFVFSTNRNQATARMNLHAAIQQIEELSKCK